MRGGIRSPPPHLFSLGLAFGALSHEPRNNLEGAPKQLNACAAWPCRHPPNYCEAHRYVAQHNCLDTVLINCFKSVQHVKSKC